MHLTARQREQITNLLKRHKEIMAAYLFGSQTHGITGPLSDVDIGLIFRHRLTKKQDMKLLTIIHYELALLLKTSFIDLINLADVPVLLRYRAIFKGQLLFSKDRRVVNQFIFRTVQEFEDFRPHLETQAQLIVKKIATYGAN